MRKYFTFLTTELSIFNRSSKGTNHELTPLTYRLLVLLLTIFAFFLRIFNITQPTKYIFDETYYIPNAKSLLEHGVELSGNEPQFIVHPPVGKWVIALGIKIFGDNPFGWRAGVLLLGTLAIPLVCLVAKELFKSPFIALTAGLLAVVDGVTLVQSRVSILEGSLAFFILLSCYTVLKFLNARQTHWLLLSGLASGLALGVKWSAIYYIALFCSLILVSGLGRTISFLRFKSRLTLEDSAVLNNSSETKGSELLEDGDEEYREFSQITIRDFLIKIFKNLNKALIYMVIVSGTYISSWVGWFLAPDAWDRRKIAGSGVYNALTNLYYYHKDMLDFHTNLTLDHNYRASPLGWLFMWRPTAFEFQSSGMCGAKECYYEILQLGNPLIWWVGVLAIIGLIYHVLKLRLKGVKSELTVLLLLLVGYLPWFTFGKRTTFTFYTGIFASFFYIILAYALVKLIKSKVAIKWQSALFTLYFFLVLLNLIYFYPIYAWLPLDSDSWNLRMWLNNWI